MIDRRAVLAIAGLAGMARPAQAQTPPNGPAATPAPSLLERLAARAGENRHRLHFQDGRFSGPGWDLLTAEGRKASMFLVGEEHGIAENPRLAAALFTDLSRDGYDTLALETSPLMAGELDGAAREGLEGICQLFARPGSQAAFYSMREEAELLVAARLTGPTGRSVLWGLDYDVAADRLAIARLKAMPKPSAAAAALATLEAASNASWSQYDATHGPQFIFNFSGDPALVKAVRDAWSGVPAEASWMLEVLEETLEINRLFQGGRGHASNQRRADLNKRNLLRYWRAAKAEGRTPRTMFKFGASHMVRGLSTTESFDLGTLVPELASIEGGTAFNLLVLPGAGSRTAVFDPSAWTYRPGEPHNNYNSGLESVTDQAFPDAFTVIDLRPLRPLLSGGGRSATADRELVRMIHGYDAVAVLTGSTASANL